MFNTKLKHTLGEQAAQLAAQQAVIDAIDRSTARIEFTPDGTVTFANDLFLATMKHRREQVLDYFPYAAVNHAPRCLAPASLRIQVWLALHPILLRLPSHSPG